ncbi:hypothetical protein BDV24DRAFT_168616 [Aspergillus arachidicola]|uniref:Uncharacterized protein n=1 Tax=Aspergillus arachidicola TaxID=656916 RepID=A0A5N6XSB8_9EURO|nr:hypothetical protein BDV24DRAFT_168616 [Aspergillus arachidicola]
MSETYEIPGANVQLTSPSEDRTEWTVEQKPVELEIEYPEDHVRIAWEFGPIKLIDGYVDTATLEIAVAPVINQVYLGIIEGNLKDDVSVRFNLSQSMGSLRFYLRNGNEVWISLSVRIEYGPQFYEERRLVTI